MLNKPRGIITFGTKNAIEKSAPRIVPGSKGEQDMKTKTRKQAAEELLALYNAYEARPVKLATIYRRIYRLANGNWHLIGKAHDYTA